MKDNFSTQSAQYAQFRPTYPPELFAYLATLVPTYTHAWDCGTGNGQVAVVLAKTFDRVYATDISQAQLDNATRQANITYSVQAAENTDFSDNIFDLITVAQAIHWFDFELFYAEVNRVAKPGAILAVIGYGLFSITEAIDEIVNEFYRNKIGHYWDPERRYIDEHYQPIPFPFNEIKTPYFSNAYAWSFEHLVGYLKTWSAVKHFEKANGHNPVDSLIPNLKMAWGNNDIQEMRIKG